MEKTNFTDLSKKAQARVLETFESNDNIDILLVTTDGNCFTGENHAFSHEQTLVNAAKSDADKQAARGVAVVVREDVGEGKAKAKAKAKAKVETAEKIEITQEILDDNPELVDAGVEVGDVAEEEETVEVSPIVKAKWHNPKPAKKTK